MIILLNFDDHLDFVRPTEERHCTNCTKCIQCQKDGTSEQQEVVEARSFNEEVGGRDGGICWREQQKVATEMGEEVQL